MHKVKAPKVVLHPLPGVAIEDVKKLVCSCSTPQALRDRAILLCLLDTGARASEFLALDVRNIDLITGAVRIEHGKGDKSRTVYLGSTSRKAVRRYLKSRGEMRPNSPIWVTDDGERLKFSGLRQIIERCAGRAGVTTPGLHDFRRSFALTMLRNGVDLQTISRLLGHSSLSVTERYLAQEQTDLADGHRRGSPVDNAGF
jgi:integrase/recombinase XerD